MFFYIVPIKMTQTVIVSAINVGVQNCQVVTLSKTGVIMIRTQFTFNLESI